MEVLYLYGYVMDGCMSGKGKGSGGCLLLISGFGRSGGCQTNFCQKHFLDVCVFMYIIIA